MVLPALLLAGPARQMTRDGRTGSRRRASISMLPPRARRAAEPSVTAHGVEGGRQLRSALYFVFAPKWQLYTFTALVCILEREEENTTALGQPLQRCDAGRCALEIVCVVY